MESKSFIETDFVRKLQASLSKPLPGLMAQLGMASKTRFKRMPDDVPPDDAVGSSVLILLFPQQNKLHTVLIQRQTYDGVHSGQISFPGGRIESSDTDFYEAALREAREEVNIDPQQVKVIGTLTPLYIPPSNFLVYPVVGFSLIKPDFIPQQSEVAAIIEPAIDFLFDPNLRKEKTIEIRGTTIDTPYFDVQGYTVWGATAMIFNELKTVIERMRE